jgi:hypothetical protein
MPQCHYHAVGWCAPDCETTIAPATEAKRVMQ